MKLVLPIGILLFCTISLCCSTDKLREDLIDNNEVAREALTGEAAIVGLKVSGEENAYSFSVSISSPDKGCEQYADWWEVIDTDGKLIYRRVLSHSHVDEQPFTRSGGPVTIADTTEVFVRAHMNNTGYGQAVIQGSIANGFAAATLDPEFAEALAEVEPLPNDCAF